MTRFGMAWVAAVALLLAGPAPALRAATPADTLVIAKNIDDIISLDPAEVFELSGGEMINQLYDRVMAYEAEDTAKLVPASPRATASATTAARSPSRSAPASSSIPAIRCARRTSPSRCNA